MAVKRILSLLAITSLLACNKEQVHDPLTPGSGQYTFDYRGKTYQGSSYAIDMDGDKNLQELFLYESGLFGGAVHFYPVTNCGFMVPDGLAWEWATYMNPNCRIKVNGSFVIDSAAVYFYKSGFIHYTLSSCETHSGYTLDGSSVKWDQCTVTGTFALALENKNKDRIDITNGSFRYEKYRIYH